MKALDKVLLAVAALGMITLMYLVFMVVPADRAQGIVQKVFYVHVPAAWVAFMAFGVVALCSAIYLWLRDDRLDMMAVITSNDEGIPQTVHAAHIMPGQTHQKPYQILPPLHPGNLDIGCRALIEALEDELSRISTGYQADSKTERALLVSVLSVVALALIGILVIVVNR